MMDVIMLLFTIANILFLLGIFILLRRVLENRDALKDFDPLGAFFIFLPMLIMCVGYVLWHNWLSLISAILTACFWLVVLVYSVKNNITKSGKDYDNLPKKEKNEVNKR